MNPEMICSVSNTRADKLQRIVGSDSIQGRKKSSKLCQIQTPWPHYCCAVVANHPKHWQVLLQGMFSHCPWAIGFLELVFARRTLGTSRHFQAVVLPKFSLRSGRLRKAFPVPSTGWLLSSVVLLFWWFENALRLKE